MGDNLRILAPLAQLDRAEGFYPSGRRFKSSRAFHGYTRAPLYRRVNNNGKGLPDLHVGRGLPVFLGRQKTGIYWDVVQLVRAPLL